VPVVIMIFLTEISLNQMIFLFALEVLNPHSTATPGLPGTISLSPRLETVSRPCLALNPLLVLVLPAGATDRLGNPGPIGPWLTVLTLRLAGVFWPGPLGVPPSATSRIRPGIRWRTLRCAFTPARCPSDVGSRL
jgi:hypothetical protein